MSAHFAGLETRCYIEVPQHFYVPQYIGASLLKDIEVPQYIGARPN